MSLSSLARKPLKVNFFLGTSTSSVYKGAFTWKGKALMLGPGLVFFDKFSLNGPSLSYSHFQRGQSHSLRASIRYFDDEEPMIKLDDTKRSFRNSRPDSVPVSVAYRYKFGFRNKFYIGARVEKDIAEYKGSSYELHIGTPLVPFTSLNIVQAYSSSQSNKYYYGHEASSGASFTKVGIGLFIPFIPFDGKMQASFDKYIINQGSSRHANLVRGAYNNDVAVLRFFWQIY